MKTTNFGKRLAGALVPTLLILGLNYFLWQYELFCFGFASLAAIPLIWIGVWSSHDDMWE